MKRLVLSVPINATESERITSMMASEQEGCETAAEFVRLLLCREWNRRRRLGKPKASDWQSAFRKGRPVSK
jgi:hypothetical protein